MRYNVCCISKWRWIFYCVPRQTKSNTILGWNIACRTIPDKTTLKLTNYGHFLQIKKVQLTKMWAAPLDCTLAKAVPGTVEWVWTTRLCNSMCLLISYWLSLLLSIYCIRQQVIVQIQTSVVVKLIKFVFQSLARTEIPLLWAHHLYQLLNSADCCTGTELIQLFASRLHRLFLFSL